MNPPALDTPYALEMVSISESKVPFAGRRKVVTRSWAQVTFSRRDDGVILQTTAPCAVEVDGGQVQFPDSFVASLPVKTMPTTWTDTYTLDGGATWVGMKGPPPDDLDDAVTTDPDNDGHPGVTVKLVVPVFGSIRLYIQQVSHSRFTGRWEGEDLVGEVQTVRLDQRTLGASVPGFAVSPTVTPLDGESGFRLRRDPGRKCRGAFPPPSP